MLIVKRKPEEAVVICPFDGPHGARVVVRVLGIAGNRVKLGIDAPDGVLLLREELQEQPERRSSDRIDALGTETRASTESVPDGLAARAHATSGARREEGAA